MWHVGIDLHRLTVVIAAVDDEGNSSEVRRIECQDRQPILETMRSLQPVRAVIKATGTYLWLYDLLAPLGTVLLAHPLRRRPWYSAAARPTMKGNRQEPGLPRRTRSWMELPPAMSARFLRATGWGNLREFGSVFPSITQSSSGKPIPRIRSRRHQN